MIRLSGLTNVFSIMIYYYRHRNIFNLIFKLLDFNFSNFDQIYLCITNVFPRTIRECILFWSVSVFIINLKKIKGVHWNNFKKRFFHLSSFPQTNDLISIKVVVCLEFCYPGYTLLCWATTLEGFILHISRIFKSDYHHLLCCEVFFDY